MKPVVICRFAPHEGPGYFATYLEHHRIPWRLLKLDAGECLVSVGEIGGLGLMGGPMSANDDLPWIAPVLQLISDSVKRGVPVIGHCLGGQLMARALGGEVRRNSVKEIGWGHVDAIAGSAAAEWGTPERFLSFHWHGETFSIPRGAERIWSSAYCANQAFVTGKHLAMQCHVEMTDAIIDRWCATGAEEIEESIGGSPAVQTARAMREGAARKIEALNAVADRIYARWVGEL